MCSLSFCARRCTRSCGGHTRMAERQNLSALHALLAIGLSEGVCSPILCVKEETDLRCHSAYRSAHARICSACRSRGGRTPNDRAVEPAGTICAAGNRFVREHILTSVKGAPEWRSGGTCWSHPRRQKSIFQGAKARACSVRRTNALSMPCVAPSGRTHLRNHAKDVKPSRLRKRECFAGPSSVYASPSPGNLRSPHMLSLRTAPASVKGVWGLSPHVYHSPLPFAP